MSKTTVWRVLRKHLVFTPYRIQMLQLLTDEDHRRRLDFCLQLQDLMSCDHHFPEKVQFSDEATFHVSCAVNRHNVRIWGSENPHAYVQHQRDSPKVNEFCAISSQKVYGPFFFAEEAIAGMIYLDINFMVTPCINNIQHFNVYSHTVHSTHASQVTICSHNTDDVLYSLYVSTLNQLCNF